MNYSPDGANAFAYISKVDFGNEDDSIYTRWGAPPVDWSTAVSDMKPARNIEKSLCSNIGIYSPDVDRSVLFSVM